MCRFIVYSGPPVVLAKVVTEPGHGLLHQSKNAHDHRTPLNADGFGLSWYVPDITPFPAIYKEVTPAWSNMNLQSVTKVTKSHLFLAHVRAASTGTVVQSNCHPFCWRNLSFMHNGTVAYFSELRRKMVNLLSERAFSFVEGSTDSELLFGIFITYFERNCKFSEDDMSVPYNTNEYSDKEMAVALSETLQQVHRLILEHELHMEGAAHPNSTDDSPSSLECTEAVGRLNLVVTDGHYVVASRYTTSRPETVHTLYLSHGSQYTCERGHSKMTKTPGVESRAIIISSEPISHSFECDEVPINHLVVVGKNGGVRTISV